VVKRRLVRAASRSRQSKTHSVAGRSVDPASYPHRGWISYIGANIRDIEPGMKHSIVHIALVVRDYDEPLPTSGAITIG